MAYAFNRITPEQAGIPSSAISAFLDKMEEKGIVLHSFLIVKDGNLCLEAYWKPFDKDFKHRLYSSSKSFTSVAIGILIGEGKLSLDDKAISFFPDKVPADVSPLLAMTTIRDLLRMASPYAKGATYTPMDPDWGDTMFAAETNHYPGTVYQYDTTATTMLCMIVKRITGEDIIDYLKPRLFDHIGISRETTCVKTPCGYDWGGSGVLATPRDFARFATICLNMGKHEGKELIPEWYMREATSKQIDNRSAQTHPESCFGYGYQFWMTRYNGFATTGMGCQLSINLPEYGCSFVFTGDTQSIPNGYPAYVYPAVWDFLYPHLTKKCPLPENPEAYQALCDRVANLSVPTTEGDMTSPLAEKVNGKEYILQENPMKISRIKFTFEGDEGVMAYTNATGDHEIRFGFGHQVRGIFPETHYFDAQIGVPANRGYDIITSGAWTVNDSLIVECFAIDKYFGKIRMTFGFKDDKLTVMMQKVAEWFFNEYQGIACGEAK